MIVTTKRSWGSVMYLDTSNVQSLKEKLLLCAVNEFAEYGYEGARVDNIVKAAGCSKQTVYHHFGNKENLFIEVLEYTWNDIRQKEKALDFSDLPPQKAIEKIIDFTWDYYISNPWFLKIVHSENQSKGVHYAKSQRLIFAISHFNQRCIRQQLHAARAGNRQVTIAGDAGSGDFDTAANQEVDSGDGFSLFTTRGEANQCRCAHIHSPFFLPFQTGGCFPVRQSHARGRGVRENH